MYNSKRGQITMFIIVGLLVLIGVVLAIYTSNTAVEDELDTAVLKSLTVPAEFEPIKAYVEGCVASSVDDALELISFQGGIAYASIDQPRLLYSTYDFEMPFWYYNGEDTSPSNGVVAAQFDIYINETFLDCINGFEGLEYDVEYGEVSPLTQIAPTAIVIDLEFPVKVNLKDKEYSHRRFVVTVPSHLSELLDIAHMIVDDEVANPNLMDLTMLSELDADVAISEYTEDVSIITLYHKTDTVGDYPLTLNFANKYNFSLGENRDPILETMDDFDVMVGAQVEYYVFAYDLDGDVISYEAFNPYFDIDPETGLINFTVTEYMIGNKTVTVTVEDDNGGYDSETFSINFFKGSYTPPTNQAPVLDIPGVIEVPGGSLFIYQVEASDPEGDYLMFTDTVELFDITPEGLIAYVPIDTGEWTGDITVSDGEMSDTKTVIFKQVG